MQYLIFITELTAANAIQADCDVKATNIILQGLPTEIYALVIHHRVAKDIWERIQLLMQGTSLTKQERESDELDAYDSDCVELNTSQVALMANLSRFSSDALVEVHNPDNVNNLTNQDVQQDSLILSMIEQLKTQVVNYTHINLNNKSVNDTLTAKLERYKEQIKVLKEGQNVEITSKDKLSDSHEQNAEIDPHRHIAAPSAEEQRDRARQQSHLDIVNVVVNSSVDNASVNVHECEKCLKIETELLNKKDFIEKETYDKLLKILRERHSNTLVERKINKSLSGNVNKDKVKKDIEEIETINIELDHRVSKLIAENEHLKQTYKQLYDSIKPARVRSKEQCDTLINQVNQKSMEIFDLNAKLQEQGLVLTALKNDLRKLKGKALVENELLIIIRQTCPSINNPNDKLVAVTPKNKDKRVRFAEPITSVGTTKTKTDSSSNLVSNKTALSTTRVKPSTSASGSQPSGNTKKDKIQQLSNSTQKNKVESNPRNVKSSLKNKKSVCNGCMLSDNHDLCVLNYVNDVCAKSKSIKKISKRKVVQIILWYLDSGFSKHMTGDRSQLTNFVSKFLGIIKFKNNQVAKIMGYGDYHIRNVTISRVYYVEGLRHNLFSVEQFCDSNHEVAFRPYTCLIRNLEGNDLLTGPQGKNLYTMSFGDMMASSLICLLSKASKTKSWLWHQCLSHLNFGVINHLARYGLVRGLPKLKFEKDHLCLSDAMGKSQKKPYKPKSEDTNQEKLDLLNMDLYGRMRVVLF
ncbi:retrovirus-related pol polyprotein from transposon TNT 1-94 [Tanacetum coccineum]